MGPLGNHILFYLLFLLLLFNQSISCQNDAGHEEVATCNTEQLSHSTLVECKGPSCAYGLASFENVWPSNVQEISHIQSTRSGDRFKRNVLTNLNLVESEDERLLNINTTVYVSTKLNQVKHQSVIGFGATLDTKRLLSSPDEVAFESAFLATLSDLFGSRDASTNQLTILRLPIEQQQDLARLLRLLDDLMGKIRPNDDNSKGPIKVLIDLQSFDSQALYSYGESMIVDMASSVPGFRSSNLEIWAVAVDLSDRVSVDILDKMCSIMPDSVVALGYSRTKPVLKIPKSTCLKGYLLKSMASTPYEVMDSLREYKTLVTIPSDKRKTADYGDWQNAHNFALELMNHLKFGSMAPIDEMSVVEVLDDWRDQDSSIYSLHKSHMLHFRGPMYYAMGHFSRYVVPNSRPLDIDVFTQPNMFAAHYSAYITPDGHNVIGVVLNDNEHLLPFRLAIDGRIMAHTFIQPKSFNTLLIKLK